MGALELKKKAITWIQAGKDHGPLTMEVASLQKENKTLSESLEALQEQVRIMSIQLEAKGAVVAPVPQEVAPGISASDIIETTPTPAQVYESKFGKPPHHRMKLETVLEKIKE